MTHQQQFLQEEVPDLIRSLQADSQPVWGLMSAQHMLEHVSGLLYISLGKKALPVMTPPDQLESSLQWLMSTREFPLSIAVPGIPKNPGPLRFASFDEAKEKFLGSLRAFFHHYEKEPEAEAIHPIFGQINKEQWEQFHYKHIQHHLMQFALVPLSEYKMRKLADSV